MPTQLRAAVLAPGKEVEEIARPLGLVVAGDGDGVLRLEATFGDRQRAYQAAIVSGMRDVVYRYRVPDHIMTVSPEDARNSLAVALEAEAAAREVSPRKVSSAPAPAVASS